MSAEVEGRPGWFRRHKAATGLAGLLVVLLAVVVGWAGYLNSQISHVPRIDAGIQPPPRVGAGGAAGSDEGAKQRGVNILLGGTDSRRPGELAALVRSGWTAGAMRSDTIMLLHLTRDRKRAFLVSIPRDTWAAVPGHGDQKINAAFSYGGPVLYVDTIERFTGLRVDHLAVIDWEGFKALSKNLGGVDVTVPQTVTDSANNVTWHKGTVHLEGEKALLYVRQRHGLPNGDFDRINRQQNFLRAVMAKLLSKGTLLNPITLTNTVQTLTAQLTLDSTFSDSEVRRLALSLRHLRAEDVTFLTVPLKNYARINGQAANIVDPRAVHKLFAAVQSDNIQSYLREPGSSILPPPRSVH